MIGPGTGIAPYIGFIKQAIHKKNKNQPFWLFFGDQSKNNDYVYHDLLTHAQTQINLSISLAFSRDQKHKIYVQNLLWDNQHEIYQWIQKGAIIYICGDAKKMAKNVISMFETILSRHMNISTSEACSVVKQLKKNKKIKMDVY